ncbi:PAP2 family lipid A phosphatase [Psychrobacter sp. CAL346-MNA-CIBAN-0220]|uniref:PAP2 family lipid A phosphatase n=1 Tax=Psychrobacter sp. CAL346-MNA-CIBAN-0220 TaxID=3140457 RepID=UPI00331D0C49
MNQMNTRLFRQWLTLLTLAILSTLTFEHSQLDLRISEIFYENGHWLLEKDAQPYAFIFYDFPKALLILFGIYLLIALIVKYRQSQNSMTATTKSTFSRLLTILSSREIGYLLITLIAVPTIIASLKGVTHVSCPNHLYLFNGDLPYLSIWQNILAKTDAKCFPAAHASAGFALYGFAYLPSLRRHRGNVIVVASILGWTMGLYKMFIGDHFFSHTLVSMLLSWTLACGIAIIFFTKTEVKNTEILNAAV